MLKYGSKNMKLTNKLDLHNIGERDRKGQTAMVKILQ